MNFGEHHGDIATHYTNLSSVCNSIGEYNQVQGLYEKALLLFRELFCGKKLKRGISAQQPGRIQPSSRTLRKSAVVIQRAFL